MTITGVHRFEQFVYLVDRYLPILNNKHTYHTADADAESVNINHMVDESMFQQLVLRVKYSYKTEVREMVMSGRVWFFLSAFILLIPGYPDVPEPFYPLDSSPDSGRPTDCGSIFTYSATPHNLM